VIAPLVGTPFLPPLDGAILLLEDVGEASYRIDRLLTHLSLAGLLGKLAGIALGDFAGCTPRNPDEPTVEEVLEERLGGLGIPVLSGLPIGHGKRNVPVLLGARATLDADRGELSFER
jgi:muramoyltetrapeptide carboxypeptidase